MNHHGLWDAFCKRGLTSVPLSTHVLIPPLLLSIRYSFIVVAVTWSSPSHGQPLFQTQLRETGKKKRSRYSSLCIYLHLADTKMDVWIRESKSFQPCAFTRCVPLRWSCLQECGFGMKCSKYFEVHLSGCKDQIHHTAAFPWGQSGMFKMLHGQCAEILPYFLL